MIDFTGFYMQWAFNMDYHATMAKVVSCKYIGLYLPSDKWRPLDNDMRCGTGMGGVWETCILALKT